MSSSQHLLMPLLAILPLAFIVALLRWSQMPDRRAARRPLSRGLLVPVAQRLTESTADRVVHRLRNDGLHATESVTSRGIDVLVWRAEYAAARRLLTQGGGSARRDDRH